MFFPTLTTTKARKPNSKFQHTLKHVFGLFFLKKKTEMSSSLKSTMPSIISGEEEYQKARTRSNISIFLIGTSSFSPLCSYSSLY